MMFWIGFGFGVISVLVAAVAMLAVLRIVQLIGQMYERRRKNVLHR